MWVLGIKLSSSGLEACIFFCLFLPAEPSCLLSVSGIFQKELGGRKIRAKGIPYTKGTVFPERTGQRHMWTHSNHGRMHKGCTGYRQTKIPAQRTEDRHNVPLLAEELQAVDSHWEKEREFSSFLVTDCGNRTKPFIGLTSAEAFHGAVLLNQWCFSPYFPVFCWSRSLFLMVHSTPQQSCFSTVTPSPTSRWKAQ